MKRISITAGILIFLFLTKTTFALEEARLLRFPTIFKDKIVFTYAGDLYTVAREGGIARRLTSHKGYEMFPRFSPGGKHLAFTAQYDGNTEVYVMPSRGGSPKRLTYAPHVSRAHVWDRMGPDNIVMGWKNDSQHVIYRSRAENFVTFKGRLKLANINGKMPRDIPLYTAGFCSYSPNNKKLAFNRIFREFRTWKRYQGGMAGDIYIIDLQTGELEKITGNPAQDIFPMWKGKKIYFISDRTGTMNLYSYSLVNKKIKRITNYDKFDIKFPSLGYQSIVFEKGGYIYYYDFETKKVHKVDIFITDDVRREQTRLADASKNLHSAHISQHGNRILFNGRGEIFSLPSKDGVTYNLTKTSGIHERSIRWSPKGDKSGFISDRTGEDEIYIQSSTQKEKPVQLTQNGDTYKFKIRWSPDGEKILWSDKKQRLSYVDVNNKEVVLVDSSGKWEIRDFEWSPDSRWIVYSRHEINSERRIYLYNVKKEEKHAVTEGWYESYAPAFSPDGKYLYFISRRIFNPIYSRTEWNHAYINMARIYILPLSAETPSPFKPENDELILEEKKDKKKQPKIPPKKIEIDIEGVTQRIGAVPVKASQYWNIQPVQNGVYYMEKAYNDKKQELKFFSLDKKKENSLGNINGYQLSYDQKKMLVRKKGRNYYVIKTPQKKLQLKEKVPLSGMEVEIDLQKEWKQIFNESWRQMRDFFYAPNMHEVDWKAMREKYAPMVKHVRHRADLTYITGEMIGELNAGHAYVGGGDLPEVKTIKTGRLGAELVKDKASGFFRVDSLFQGANWSKKLRSPLTETGVNVQKGDYILAINGIPTNDMENIYKALVNTAGKKVMITVGSKPKLKNGRDVVVTPITNEKDLRYYTWVQNNIEKVTRATGGKVGYLHVPDMGRHGLNEFVKHFYPQIRKEALIVDMRGNAGGNVSPMLIERLRRTLTMVTKPRNASPRPNPSDMILGRMICLLDEWSASDGDLFPYRFRKHNLGKLVGQRSWGGVVGIRGSLPITDGGYLYKPEFAKYDTKGKKWIIEGHGVEPDIEVFNNPWEVYKGKDKQLQRAIKEISGELKKKKHKLPEPPSYPDKSK